MRRLVSGAVVALILMTVAAASLLGRASADRFDGRPEFKEGKALGYFVWRDGDTWKVRWTTFGAEHHFSGRVEVQGGKLESLKRIDVDEERRVIAPGRPGAVVRGPRGRVRAVRPGRAPVVASREEDHIEQETEHLIRFVTRTDDDIDGFDFKVTDGTVVLRLLLEMDGRPVPGEVEVGRQNFMPHETPLVIALK